MYSIDYISLSVSDQTYLGWCQPSLLWYDNNKDLWTSAFSMTQLSSFCVNPLVAGLSLKRMGMFWETNEKRQANWIRLFKVNCLFCIPVHACRFLLWLRKQHIEQIYSNLCFVFRAPAYKLEFLGTQNRQMILNGLTRRSWLNESSEELGLQRD